MNEFIPPTYADTTVDKKVQVPTDVQMELLAFEVNCTIESVSDPDIRGQIKNFLSHYLNLKRGSKGKAHVDRDSVLKELKENLDQISNEPSQEAEGNGKYDDTTNDILKSASTTLYHLEDLTTIRSKLAKTNGLLGNLCENLDWKMKTVEDLGITANDWAVYPRRLLADIKGRLAYGMKFSSYTRKKHTVDAVNEEFKKATEECDKWTDRLSDLQDVLRRKTKRMNDMKQEIEHHEGNRLRESIESKVKSIEEKRQYLMHNFMSMLCQAMACMTNMLFEMDKNTRKIHSRLLDDIPSLKKIVDAFSDLNVSLQNSVTGLKSKATTQPRELCRLRKLLSTAKQVRKEFQTVTRTEALVMDFTHLNITPLTSVTDGHLEAVMETLADGVLSKDHVTFCANLFVNTVVELCSASETMVYALFVMRENARIIRFGSFKLDVIKFDLLNTKTYSEGIVKILDPIMVPFTCMTRKTLLKHTSSGMASESYKTPGKKSQTRRRQGQGQLPNIGPSKRASKCSLQRAPGSRTSPVTAPKGRRSQSQADRGEKDETKEKKKQLNSSTSG